jgi:anti-anti-sigma factor
VQGELDSASAQQLATAFGDALRRGELEAAMVGRNQPAFRITLDLDRVDFIDSGGLRMLIVIQKEAEEHDLQLTVLAPPDEVTELLHLSGVAERVNLQGEGGAPSRESDFLERVDLDLDADDRAPQLARAAVRESLGSVLSEDDLASIVLMTSELVTNGIVHSTGGMTVGLRLTRFADAVRVEIDDPGVGFDPSVTSSVPAAVPAPDEGGRGLFVVDHCATRWGTRQSETDRGRRFSVWFEVETESV